MRQRGESGVRRRALSRIVVMVVALLTGAALAAIAAGASPFALTGTEGQAVSGTVATLTEACGGAREPDCPPHPSAQIVWGDGLTGTGTVVGESQASNGAGIDTVAGAHIYTTAGIFTATATQNGGSGTGVISIAATTPSTTTATDTTTTSVSDPTPPASPPASPPATPPSSTGPISAAFTFAPETALANVPVQFAGSGTGSGTLSYQWSFCGAETPPFSVAPTQPPTKFKPKAVSHKAPRFDTQPIATPYCGYALVPTSSAQDPTFTFPYAMVHDTHQFPGGADKVRRQESYKVTLTVTDQAGASASVTHYVTVSPDTAPSVSLHISPDVVAPGQLVTITPQAYDNNAPAGQITEEDWDLGRSDGPQKIKGPVLVCTPGQCQPGPGALSDPASPTAAGASAPYATPDVRTAFGAHQTTPRRIKTVPCPPSCIPSGFPAFRFDFDKQALLAAGLVPLSEIDITQAQDPATAGDGAQAQPEAEASFLNEYAYEVQNDTPIEYGSGGPGSVPNWGFGESQLPTKLGLTVKTNAGQTAGQTVTATAPIQFKADPPPNSQFAYEPPTPPASNAITQDSVPEFNFDHVATSSPVGIKYYVLQVGDPQNLDTTCPGVSSGGGGGGGGPSGSAATGHGALKPVPQPGKQPPTFNPNAPAPATPYTNPIAHVVAPTGWQDLLNGAKAGRNAPCGHFGIKNPIDTIVTTDLSDLTNTMAAQPIFANAQTGHTYSVMLTVYDALGVSARTRIDGFYVQEATGCSIPTQNLDDDGATVGLSGAGLCAENDSHSLFASQNAINLNGLTLKPAAGDWIGVADDYEGSGLEIFTSASQPKDGHAVPDGCLPVSLLVDLNPVGGWKHFCISDGQTLLDGDPDEIDTLGAAAYDSQSLADVTAAIGSGASSQLVLTPQLPQAFEAGTQGGAATGTITLNATNPPLAQNFTTGSSNTVDARHHHGRLRVLPDYRPHGLGQDALSIAEGSLGSSIPLPPGLTFTYDSDTGIWTGEADLAIPGLAAAGSIDTTIKFSGDQLVSATGSFSGDIPIGGVIDLTGLNFGISSHPLTITSGITLSALDILDGTGTLTVMPDSPWDVRFDGSLSLISLIPLGNAYFEASQANGFSFGGGFDYDFGPASLSATIQGQIAGHQWYVEGDGEACIGICVDVDAVASNIGVAGCGSVDLVFTTVGIGVGYTWGDHSLHLLGGSCDLSNYVPQFDSTTTPDDLTALNTQNAARRATRSPHKSASDTFTVTPGQRALAVTFHGTSGDNISPQVTLYEPPSADNKAGRTVVSPATIGDYAFGNPMTKQNAPSVYTTENPISDTTTFVISAPNPGTWSFSVDQGSPAVTAVDTATALPAVTNPHGLAIVTPNIGHVSNAIRGRERPAALQLPSALRRLPAIELRRVRELQLTVPTADGTVVIVDQGERGGGSTLGVIRGKERHADLVFDPPPHAAGRQRIIAYYLGANDLPRASRVLETFMPPPLPTIPKPSIVKVIRRSHQAELLLARGPADTLSNDIAYRVETVAGDGTNQSFLVLARQVRTIDGHPAIVDKGISRQAGAKFLVSEEYEGHAGPGVRAESRGVALLPRLNPKISRRHH